MKTVKRRSKIFVLEKKENEPLEAMLGEINFFLPAVSPLRFNGHATVSW